MGTKLSTTAQNIELLTAPEAHTNAAPQRNMLTTFGQGYVPFYYGNIFRMLTTCSFLNFCSNCNFYSAFYVLVTY